MEGDMCKELPVHARSALFCAIFQSSVPSRCKTANEVRGDLVDIKALIGDVEVIYDSFSSGRDTRIITHTFW